MGLKTTFFTGGPRRWLCRNHVILWILRFCWSKYGGFQSHRDTPSSHPFVDGIFLINQLFWIPRWLWKAPNIGIPPLDFMIPNRLANRIPELIINQRFWTVRTPIFLRTSTRHDLGCRKPWSLRHLKLGNQVLRLGGQEGPWPRLEKISVPIWNIPGRNHGGCREFPHTWDHFSGGV